MTKIIIFLIMSGSLLFAYEPQWQPDTLETEYDVSAITQDFRNLAGDLKKVNETNAGLEDSNTFTDDNTFTRTITAGNIANAFHLLVSTVIHSVSVTTITFSGLDLGTDGMYYIVMAWKNGTAGTITAKLFVEGDYLATNYYTQSLKIDHATVTGERTNSNYFCIADGNSESLCISQLIRDPIGMIRIHSVVNYGDASGVKSRTYDIATVAAVTNVTTIDIVSGTGAFAAQTRVYIYKTR